MSEKIDLYKNQIEKTGYILEYQVSEILSKHKWNVINNRYYVDDITENVREIDIVAYKVKLVKDIYYYTALLISCKKSEENDWVFLSKNADKLDPNLDYLPISNWTNERYIEYMLKNSDWKNRINNNLQHEEFLNNIYKTEKKVFAFQEMKKTNGAPQNDKKIFESISTLIKALAFELKSLSERKQSKCFYNFNLISVAQTDLVNMNFYQSNLDGYEVNNINYINRFIVSGKDEFFKVNIVKYDNFENILCGYDELFNWNKKFYSDLRDEFFSDIVSDYNKIQFQYSICKKQLLNIINAGISKIDNDNSFKGIQDIDFGYFDQELILYLDIPDTLISKLNINKFIESHVGRILKNYFN
ncbi:MAG: hypothetical protein WAM24_09590, partial [Ignavibacteriaceae bacterium]